VKEVEMRWLSGLWGIAVLIVGACGGSDAGSETGPTRSTPQPDFQIACGTTTLSLGRGCASSTCTVTAANGFADTVALRFSSLPPGIDVASGKESLAVSEGVPALTGLTVSVAPDVDPGTYGLEVTGVSGALARSFDMELVWNGASPPTIDPGRGPMALTGCAGYRDGVRVGSGLQHFQSVFVGAWSKTWRGDGCDQTLSADDGFFTFFVPRRCFRQGQPLYLTSGGLDTCVSTPYASGQHAHVTLLGGENVPCD
jgi:hypothetical protein